MGSSIQLVELDLNIGSNRLFCLILVFTAYMQIFQLFAKISDFKTFYRFGILYSCWSQMTRLVRPLRHIFTPKCSQFCLDLAKVACIEIPPLKKTYPFKQFLANFWETAEQIIWQIWSAYDRTFTIICVWIWLNFDIQLFNKYVKICRNEH